ncbi:MAG: HAMP domain-containing protein [Rhodobacterales bacterium]|nr:HAMP domain-containing protein [Rhodobacterales bacterium]
MSNPLSQHAPKASWALFEGLFIIAALVAVFATFITIAGVNPDNPTAGSTPWLLALNLVLIIVLAIIVVREFLAIRGRSREAGEGRLAQRFVMLFGFSALVPSMVVGIFLGAVVTRGLDNWFGDTAEAVMEKNKQIFQDYVDNFTSSFDVDVRLAALDVENFARDVKAQMAIENGGQDVDGEQSAAKASAALSEGLRKTLAYREFVTISIVSADGQEIIAEENAGTPVRLRPSPDDFAEAQKGEVAARLYEAQGVATALIRISEPVDGFVYAAKPFDRNLFTMLGDAKDQLAQYQNAKQRSGRLQTIFAIGYAQITALILLLAGRLGLEAAGRITGPIGRLASAAHTVRDGDLTVRVPVNGPKDEVYALSQSFNAMTEQLFEQRNALIRAREDEEDRRRFVETLLAEVSAGVIRMDADMTVTLANRSAGDLLDAADIKSGEALEVIAPEFERFVRDTLERNSPVDASIEIMRNGATRHIRLKAAPDPAGGCVLTFDDMTRLINAQRQMAWRDVARRIAHEIRNPLTPIMLSTERLRRRYASKIDDHDGVFEKCIDTILRQVGDIGRMVEEFSSFARMPKPSVAPFDMRGLLQEASFSRSVVNPDIDFEFESGASSTTYVGDERLIGQAIGNLLKNAAEAIEGMPEELDVQGQIRLELNGDERGLEITIEDNGPGFPEDVRERLLEPYVTTREKGTGLGLAIVNRIIADHGGSISLQNRPDGLRGARVRVWLPPHDLMTETSMLPADERIAGNNPHSPKTVRVEEPTPWR